MDPVTLMLLSAGITGGMGLLSQREQAEKAKQDKLLNAEITRYQPWTGAQTQAVTQAPSPMQALMSGGLGGAQFGLGLGKSLAGSNPAPTGVDSATMAMIPHEPQQPSYLGGNRKFNY